jgi:transglutaminase-like putative cysteine protease
VAGRTAAATGGNWVVSATPTVAGLATLCASTALSSVIDGVLWLLYLAVAIAVVVGTGVVLRSTRLPGPVIGLVQLFALLCLLVTLFTRTGVLVVFPGPESLGDLMTVLGESITEVQTGVPPVPDSPAMRCLVMLAIGLVAILVDTLAVAAAAPAASGLVLLCVFAVPASLADEMLPLWTFVFGAGAFALLLAVDGQHRHEAWRGRLATSGANGSGPAATAVAGSAMVIALLAGASLTLVGTVGRLPGTGDEIGGGSGGLGIDPMTELRGMLNQGSSKELFRVRGLENQQYMRAMTLRQYVPDKGWQLGENLPEGVPANGELPPQPGDPGTGDVQRVTIEPTNWIDNWLPVYGQPRRIENVENNWRYDQVRGMVYSVRPRKNGTYNLDAVLTTPAADSLRRASGPTDEIDPVYFDAPGVDPRVQSLAREVTRTAGNNFDKATALYRFFTDGTQGFKYETQTEAATTSDALTDFVFNGKKGFCEQYASAMAIMARSIGLPARVALGFTAGFPTSEYQSIGTQDAHAWVEIFFPGYGWTTFDPTPLSDGRGVVPPYISGLNPDGEETDTGTTSATTTTTTAAPGTEGSTSAAPDPGALDGTGDTSEPTPTWHLVTLGGALVVGLLLTLFLLFGRVQGPVWVRPALVAGAAVAWGVALVLAVALVSWWVAVPLLAVLVVGAPAAVRAVRRRSRLHAVEALGPDAAGAAWQELLAESVDRGTRVPPTETVRVAARRIARAHNLDDQGRDGLRAVVGAVERSWYSTRTEADPALPQAVADVRQSLNRNAPLALRAKVLPRSVLQPNVPVEEED